MSITCLYMTKPLYPSIQYHHLRRAKPKPIAFLILYDFSLVLLSIYLVPSIKLLKSNPCKEADNSPIEENIFIQQTT